MDGLVVQWPESSRPTDEDLILADAIEQLHRQISESTLDDAPLSAGVGDTVTVTIRMPRTLREKLKQERHRRKLSSLNELYLLKLRQSLT